MKITKKIEAEITQFTQTYWDTYLSGDLKTWATFLSDDYRNIGTTKEELWNSKQEILDYTYSVIDQMIGMAEIRDRKVDIIPYKGYFMVHELADIYVKSEAGWAFYAPVRLSTLLEKNNDSWLVRHQHGSYPDSRTDEGEAFAFDTLKAENKKLQAAVEERTKKLEQKNRELEIEAALERVRARAMAMHQTADLDKVNKELLNQLNKLKVEGLSGVSIWLINDDGMVKIWDLSSPGNMGNPNSYSIQYDCNEYDLMGEPWRILKENPKQNYFVLDHPIEKLDRAVKELEKIDLEVANSFKNALENGKLTHQWNPFARHSNGILSIDLVNPPSDDTKSIVIRMAGAFGLAYQRFLDLQKAEAQAREAQIEAALEKVRSRSLAMHKSDELGEVITVVVEKLKDLGFSVDDGVALITFTEGTKDLVEWMTNPEFASATNFNLPYFNHPVLSNLWKAKEKGEEFLFKRYSADENKSFLNYIFEFSDFKHTPQQVKDYCLAASTYATSIAFQKNTAIFINDYSGLDLSSQEIDILKRFSKVFDQTYTRFLDLQKAEAQARESEIELALERVRARSMAMQGSNELAEVAVLLFEQLKGLGIETFASGFNIWDDAHENLISWMGNASGINPPFEMPIQSFDQHRLIYDSWKKKESFMEDDIKGKNLTKLYKFLRSFPLLDESFKRGEAAGIEIPDRQVHNVAFFSTGYLLLITLEPCTQYHEIFKRFTKVFDQTYTRFLDLQKSEAQAREAEIELALERVRARSMAMQSSDELVEASDVMYDELNKLNINTLRIGICTMDAKTGAAEIWSRSEIDKQREKHILGVVPKGAHPVFDNMVKAWKAKKQFYSNTRTGDEVKKYYEKLAEYLSYPLSENYNEKETITTFFFREGSLNVVSLEPLQESDNKIMIRFSQVFGQFYRRFLDLQKAEAQAREAQIEAALEKVRSRSLAMHKSDELEEVILVVSEQLQQLQFKFHNVSFGFETEQLGLNFWLTSPGLPKPFLIKVPYIENPALNRPIQARNNGIDFITDILSREENIQFLQHMFDYSDLSHIPAESKSFLMSTPGFARSLCLMKNTILTVGNYSLSPYSEEENAILRRFGNVFEQAYVRFLDIQKAEAQARESTIEAALEKVRGKAMSMHNSEDLSLTVDAFFKELNSLNVAPHRCGVTLIDRETRMANLTVTTATSGGKAKKVKGALKLSGHLVLDSVYEHWKMQKEYHAILHGAEIQEYYQAMNPQIEFPDFANDKTQFGYYFFFKEGGVYAWTDVELVEEELLIFRRFTTVLSLTYRRFMDLKESEAHALQAKEDLVKLQIEKKRAEDALTILKSTQSQLIQSEKMASLGELTAGIAHEIQNPLNFVNNFSEVSTELVDEMNEEIEEGNMLDVKEIASDLKQNLEKINHHGKRAGDIVKGMLQHSRSSSGVKEPTDINALADEYLRLAYHGLRAKDKSFNASMKTDFDTAIGNINIIPQDMGRVILNLITNAFYAVSSEASDYATASSDKSAKVDSDYTPTVSVSTKMEAENVLISVKDNGNGIPEQIREKIFQPFFTTKPTGQGTGLGLSLSYDIVKTHGGELKVETNEGEGTEFIISLPIV